MPVTNVNALTALEITSLPFTWTEDVAAAVNAYEDPAWGYGTVWFKFTAPSTPTGKFTIGVQASADPAAVFKPYLFPYGSEPPFLSYTSPSVGGLQVNYGPEEISGYTYDYYCPLSFTLEAGVTYYFQVGHNSSGRPLASAVLRFQAVAAPVGAAPVGSLAFIDWNGGTFPQPAVVVSATTGETLRMLEVSSADGDAAAGVLADGTFCFVEESWDESVDYNGLAIFSPQGTLVARVATGTAPFFSGGYSPRLGCVTSDNASFFYCLAHGTYYQGRIVKFTASGEYATHWTLPAVTKTGSNLRPEEIAVSRDNTVAYIGYGHSDKAGVYLFDLVGGTMVGEWVARPLLGGVSARLAYNGAVQVLDDGTVLVAWDLYGAKAYSRMVCRYSAAGAILNTYDFASHLPDYCAINGMTLAEDGASFWVWLMDGSERIEPYSCRFIHIRASDGAVLAQFDPPMYVGDNGVLYTDINTPFYFGPYYYPPFFVIRQALAGPSVWVPIANYHDVIVSYWQFKYGQARVKVDLWTSDGTMVQARLWNSTDGVSVGESVEITSTTPVETEFAVALTMGIKAYRLQVLTSEGEVDYFCVGQLMKRAGA